MIPFALITTARLILAAAWRERQGELLVIRREDSFGDGASSRRFP